MFEQDYIKRLIQEMVRAIIKLVFHLDLGSPYEELLEDAQEKQTVDSLLDLADLGRIDEAENRLYDQLEEYGEDKKGLAIALLFYAHLNEKTDAFLEENHFSRDEVRLGLKDIAARYGLEGVGDVFLPQDEWDRKG